MNTLFTQPLKVVNAGLASFADNLTLAGGDVISLSWQPPAMGDIDGGLALARAASQGCHFCVSISPAALARVALFSDETMRSDQKRLKDLDDAAAVVTRLGGALGIGVRLDPKQGALAAGLSKSLLVLSPADAAQVGKLWASVAPPPPPEDKPLSGGSKGLLR